MTQLQVIAAANAESDKLQAYLKSHASTDRTRGFDQHAALNEQQLDWERSWCHDVEEVRRALPMQLESERNNWKTYLANRSEKAAIKTHDEQQRASARQQCDEAVRQTMAGEDEADTRAKQRKALERELKVH